MRSCQFLCVLLAILVSGCASWHKPGLVFRGRPPVARQARLEKPGEHRGAGVVFTSGDEDDDSFPGESDTITPPIEGKAHRSRYRPTRTPEQQDAERQIRERAPYNPPPQNGFLELPPPPELSQPDHLRLGRLNK